MTRPLISLAIAFVAVLMLAASLFVWTDRREGRPVPGGAVPVAGDAAQRDAEDATAGAETGGGTELSQSAETNIAGNVPADTNAGEALTPTQDGTTAESAGAPADSSESPSESDAAPSEPGASGESPAAAGPSFDIVRVEPTGEALFAGQAAPGSDVEILADGDVIARTIADAEGAFVAIPEAALKPGEHDIAVLSDGQAAVGPESRVAVVVPESGGGAAEITPGGEQVAAVDGEQADPTTAAPPDPDSSDGAETASDAASVPGERSGADTEQVAAADDDASAADEANAIGAKAPSGSETEQQLAAADVQQPLADEGTATDAELSPGTGAEQQAGATDPATPDLIAGAEQPAEPVDDAAPGNAAGDSTATATGGEGIAAAEPDAAETDEEGGSGIASSSDLEGAADADGAGEARGTASATDLDGRSATPTERTAAVSASEATDTLVDAVQQPAIVGAEQTRAAQDATSDVASREPGADQDDVPTSSGVAAEQPGAAPGTDMPSQDSATGASDAEQDVASLDGSTAGAGSVTPTEPAETDAGPVTPSAGEPAADEPTAEGAAAIAAENAATGEPADAALTPPGDPTVPPASDTAAAAPSDTPSDAASAEAAAQAEPLGLAGEASAASTSPIAGADIATLSPDLSVAGAAAEASASAASGAAGEPRAISLDLSIKAAEAEARRLYVAGEAAPGTLVRVFANEELVGEARTNTDGAWLVDAAKEVSVGQVLIRADAVARNPAAPTAQVELPFIRYADGIVLEPAAAAAEPGTPSGDVTANMPSPTYVLIRRGDNLWTISRRNYGRGIRFKSIFAANRDRIRNPDRIYPGQVFVLPERDVSWETATN